MFVLLQRYTFWSNSQPSSFKTLCWFCCLYYCKDTLFEAIHNSYLPLNINWYVVCITAKIHFLKQFTTAWKQLLRYPQLFVLLQRYTFWSNSQHTNSTWDILLVVCITAKIHFLKQFTTSALGQRAGTGLFVLLQRYTFWSNSQPLLVWQPSILSCLYYCKDTLFEAIHNSKRCFLDRVSVVCITAKIHFLKQFTTTTKRPHYHLLLFVLLQRYTFWSNSQLSASLNSMTVGCLYYCKDTLFEAIHNFILKYPQLSYVVCITAKIHFLKQFTTMSKRSTAQSLLFVLLQRYTFWSNSQLELAVILCVMSCLYYCKDTLFEAIHNWYITFADTIIVVCITAKIHFLKQFTTRIPQTSFLRMLFVLLQRYTFWSNSQPILAIKY